MRVLSSQHTRDIEPMLAQCCPAVYDVGPTLSQHRFTVSCSPGYFVAITSNSYDMGKWEGGLNPFTANHDYNRLNPFHLDDQITCHRE